MGDDTVEVANHDGLDGRSKDRKSCPLSLGTLFGVDARGNIGEGDGNTGICAKRNFAGCYQKVSCAIAAANRLSAKSRSS